MLNQSREIWPRMAPALGLALLLPLAPGQDYTCPNCHETFRFPSNAGAYRAAFIKNHALVCRASHVLPPVTPDPALLARIRELEQQKAISELKRLVEKAYVDMQRARMRDQAELLISQIRSIEAAWAEFQRRVDGVIRENDGLLAQIHVQQQIAPELSALATAARSERQRWKAASERVGRQVDELMDRLGHRERDLMSSLEAMRSRGLIAGPAAHLPVPPAPRDGRELDWGVRLPRKDRATLDSTYVQNELPLPRHAPERAVRRVRPVVARRAFPDPQTISISQLLDLRAEYELLKLSVERDAKKLASDAFDAKRASQAMLTRLTQNNETLRIGVHVARQATHVYKGQLEQHCKDFYVAELRKAALDRLEKSLENRLGSRTLALGRALAQDARDELEKFTPYVSALQRLQSFGDTMHGLGRPNGYMDRLFEGIRASTYVHYDPQAADEAWSQLQKARSDLGRQLQDLGLPASFTETRRQLEKWFSHE